MATIKILQPRDQEAHFGLYKTSCGGDEPIYVRRKIADPTDYMHTKSRKLPRQRASFTLATKHYAQLTPSQKAITRHQMEDVEYQKSHGKTDTKLLTGRQLFISKEIRSLNVMQKQLLLPLELCIMLVDEPKNPLSGELWLYCTVSGEWVELPKQEIWPGNWLFSQVPRDCAPYRVYGEATGYYDPELAGHQAMTEDEIRAYHYHVLPAYAVHHLPRELTYHQVFGTGWWQPYDCSTVRVRTLIEWGEQEAQVDTFIVDWEGHHYADESYYIYSVESQTTEHLTTWTGLDLKAGTAYWYNVERTGGLGPACYYEIWVWFIP